MSVKPFQRVWVVDDDPLQVLILNRFLSSHPAVGKTKFFSGAKDAIDSFGESKKSAELPDLIFLDLVMSRGDGWEFLDFFRKSRPKMSAAPRVVVISSVNDENVRRLRQYPEVSEFLSKPIDKNEFSKLMADLSTRMSGVSSTAS